MKSKQIFVAWITVFTLCLFMAGCGGGGKKTSPPTTPTLTSISITSSSVSPALGTAPQLSVTGVYSDGSQQAISNVSWSTSNSTVATVSSTGVITTKSQGTATITASASGVSNTIVITVGPPTLVSIALSSTSVSPALGAAPQLTATGTYTDGSTKTETTVTWTSSNTSVATVSSTGVITTKLQGTATITASASGVSNTIVITVGPPSLVSLALSSTSVSPALGTTPQLTATGTYTDGSTKTETTVTWTSSNTSVATVSSSGVITTKAHGTAIITGTIGSVTNTVTIAVGAPVIQHISISPTNVTVALGLKQQFTAEGVLTDGATSSLSSTAWQSSDTTVATIDATGMVTSKAQGNTTISVSSDSLNASTSLTVTAPRIVSIAVTPDTASIDVGTTRQFTATATLSDSTSSNVTNTATWESSSTATATMDSTTLGLAHAMATGNTTITATASGVSGTAALTVNNSAPIVSWISPTSATAGGAAFTLTVSGQNFVPGSTIKWSGTSLTTTYVNSTQLTAPVAASYIATVGSAQVTVTNPAPGGGTSSASAFTINATAQSAGVLQRVSVGPDGSQTNGYSTDAAISATGRFVAFYSSATSIASNDTNNTYDVFLRDTCTGAAAGCTPTTLLVSANLAGNPGSNESLLGGVTVDGRYVVFSSSANDLTTDAIEWGTNITNVFLRDTCIGATGACTPSTQLLSVGVDSKPADSTCSDPAITPDGRYVAFYSAATNMLTDDTNNAPDIFVRDTCIGATEACVPSTTRVSLTDSGGQSNNASGYITFISATGRFVGFGSFATNLVAGDTNDASDVYLRDTCTGASGACTPTTIRVSLGSDGTQPNNWSGPNGNGGSHLPGVSADGRYVLFTTAASNLVPGDTNNVNDVFLRDTCLGATGCTPSTTLISVAADGSVSNGGSVGSMYGSISADGRFVAFRSYATNLISGGNPGDGQVFVRDTCNGVASGCTPKTVMVSVNSNGTAANPGGGGMTIISADGHYVAFRSPASNLVPNDTYWDDIFLGLTSF